MNNYNIKKRQVMGFNEFVNGAQKNVESVEKGEHEMVTKSTDKLVTTKTGVETLDEAYEMDIERGDIGDEHAKAVLDAMFEAHKESGKWDMQAALEKIAKDNGIDSADENDVNIREQIIHSIKLLGAEISKLARDLKA